VHVPEWIRGRKTILMLRDGSLQIFKRGILNAAANFIDRWLKTHNPETQCNPDNSQIEHEMQKTNIVKV
jgi:hypothetical protein